AAGDLPVCRCFETNQDGIASAIGNVHEDGCTREKRVGVVNMTRTIVQGVRVDGVTDEDFRGTFSRNLPRGLVRLLNLQRAAGRRTCSHAADRTRWIEDRIPSLAPNRQGCL